MKDMTPAPFQPESPYYESLRALLKKASGRRELLEAIVNAPFHELRQTLHLDLGIVVLLLVNKETRTIDRIALSNTEAAEGAVKMSEKPFEAIKIPLNHPTNIIARAIAIGQPQMASDWRFLFVPALSPQAARFNQAGAGIECSHVYPLAAGDGGALIFSFFQPASNITQDHINFMEAYTALATNMLAVAPQ